VAHDADAVMNLPIEATDDGKFRFGSGTFENLEAIVEKFSKVAIKGKSGGDVRCAF
jgi:hypothetical protein